MTKKLIDLGVWEREGQDELSRKAYFGLIGGLLTWSFILTAMVAQFTSGMTFNIFEFLGYGLVIPIIGILMICFSGNYLISFIGFNLLVGFGAAPLGPALNMLEMNHQGIIAQAAFITAGITFMMTAAGFTFPRFFERIGGALFVSLFAFLIVIITAMIFGFAGVWLSYIGAGLFALIIGYDMHRSTRIPATKDNAVDVAASLYLDIINLFLNILRILAEMKK